MKINRVTILTVLILAALAVVAVGRRQGWTLDNVSASSLAARLRPAEAKPEQTIYALLDAARDGDPDAFLNQYSGKLRDQLQETVREQGRDAFIAYLKKTNSDIQGVALAAPERTGDKQVKIRAEYVYRDRNEVQLVFLEQSGSAWKITRLDSTERVKALIPFGMAVTD